MDLDRLYKAMDNHNDYLEREAVDSAEKIIHSLFEKPVEELNTIEVNELQTAVENYNKYFPIVVGFNEVFNRLEE
jgi:hypothetical protein